MRIQEALVVGLTEVPIYLLINALVYLFPPTQLMALLAPPRLFLTIAFSTIIFVVVVIARLLGASSMRDLLKKGERSGKDLVNGTLTAAVLAQLLTILGYHFWSLW